MINYLSEWLNKADSDLNVAKILIEKEMHLEIIAFHCQQATEKYLKALLVYKNLKIPKTHDLDALFLLCVEEEAALKRIDRIKLSALTDFAVEYRYPVVSSPPETSEIKSYLELAQEIGNIIKDIVSEK